MGFGGIAQNQLAIIVTARDQTAGGFWSALGSTQQFSSAVTRATQGFQQSIGRIGGLLAGDRHAYRYLSDSVRGFHAPEVVSDMIRHAGFAQVTLRKFLNGAVCMHIAEKAGAGHTS